MKKMGILTVSKEDLFIGSRANFREITRMGQTLGWDVVVVPAESICSAAGRTINVFFWDIQKKKWMKSISSMPNFFYNRIPFRDVESRPVVKQAKHILTQRKIPWFNPSFFKKDQLYSLLEKSNELKSFVPRTEVYEPKSLTRWLKEEPEFYLKPVQGSKGEGILKVSQKGKAYSLQQQSVGIKKQYHLLSHSDLIKQIASLTSRKRYVLQKAIQLQRIDDCIYDLRTLVQRGRTGEWAVSGIGARVSEIHGITTHVPNGGHIETVHSVLQSSFGTDAEIVYNRLDEVAVTIAEEIANHHHELIGEMSMDLGVDSSGDIWFFEANAKPMKFDEPDIRQKSLYQLFEFGDFLTQRR